MNADEIKALIAQKIAGQGSMIDIGGALPTILNEIVDIATSAASIIYLEILENYPEETLTIEQALNSIKLNGKTPTFDDVYNLFDEKSRIIMLIEAQTYTYVLECTSKQLFPNFERIDLLFGARDVAPATEYGISGRVRLQRYDNTAKVEFFEF